MNSEPRPPAWFARSRHFIRQRFSPEGYLGLHLTIGLVVMFLAAWSFSEFAENLADSSAFSWWDRTIANWFYDHHQAELVQLARWISWLGSVRFLTFASLALAVVLTLRRAWDRCLVLALTMLGGSLLNIVLKHFFHRQRPVFENPLVTLTSYGFPSGHTMGSTLFYGLLALLAVHVLHSFSARLAVVGGSLLLIGLIGFTRIYLGAHYLSDVLAAIAAGGAWLAFSWTTVETFRRRRHDPGRRQFSSAQDQSFP